MRSPALRTVRYTRAWISGSGKVLEHEVELDRSGLTVPATLARPSAVSEPLPAWVILHGITRRGRAHDQLVRFTHALVSSGAIAVVPDVPEWRALELAPRLAVPTVEAALAAIAEYRWARDAAPGVIGFSFGGPHAIAATGQAGLRDRLAGSVTFGGYCSLERTIRFLMTGRHEWQGKEYRVAPDLYGRWVLAANYLTSARDYENASDVAVALRSLAARAGDRLIASTDSALDGVRAELRASVAEERRPLFDLFAPGPGRPSDDAAAFAMAETLAEAAHRVDPTSEPERALAAVTRPVHVLHGRRDNLIPFSESLRLRQALPSTTWSRSTETRLFGHSREDSFPSLLTALSELPRFFLALRSVLRLV